MCIEYNVTEEGDGVRRLCKKENKKKKGYVCVRRIKIYCVMGETG